MYASDTLIANRASRHLAEQGVSDISSTTHEPAIQAAEVWDEARDTWLLAAPWLYASTYAELAESATNDRSTRWDYKHVYPGDWLRTNFIANADTGVYFYRDNSYQRVRGDFLSMPMEIANRVIYSHVERVAMDYVYRFETVTDWPSYAQWGFTFWLAAFMAPALTRQADKVQKMQRLAAEAQERAMSDDFSQQPSFLPTEASWQAGRGLDS